MAGRSRPWALRLLAVQEARPTTEPPGAPTPVSGVRREPHGDPGARTEGAGESGFLPSVARESKLPRAPSARFGEFRLDRSSCERGASPPFTLSPGRFKRAQCLGWGRRVLPANFKNKSAIRSSRIPAPSSRLPSRVPRHRIPPPRAPCSAPWWTPARAPEARPARRQAAPARRCLRRADLGPARGVRDPVHPLIAAHSHRLPILRAAARGAASWSASNRDWWTPSGWPS